MTKIIKLKLTPKSSLITPLLASTIWGHIAWQIFLNEGEEKGKKFIEAFQQNASGKPPFVLSDGFPEDLLPKPFTHWDDGILYETKAEKKKELEDQKKWRKIHFLKPSDVKMLCSFDPHQKQEFGEWRDALMKGQEEKKARKLFSEEVLLKNVIDRSTNVTVDGGIFDQTETFSDVEYFSVYFRIFDDKFWTEFGMEKYIQNIFEETGFGAKKSTGKGVFGVDWEKNFDFGFSSSAEKGILLSECILKKEEMNLLNTGRYRLKAKYGKLGESLSHSENPFKQPLVQIVPGSVFLTSAEFCGGLIKTAKETEVREYVFGFLLSF